MTDWIPPGTRGTATGWKQAGVPGATLVVGLIAPGVADRVGWRLAGIASGAVLVVTLMLLLLAARGGRRWLVSTPVPRSDPAALTDQAVLGWLLPYSVLLRTAVGATNIQLVQFGVDGYALSPPVAGRLAVLTWLAALATVGVLVLATGRYAGSGRLAGVVIAAAIIGLSIQAWNGIAMLRIVTHAPPGRVGGASGRVMRGFYGGLLVGPLGFGQILQRVGYGPAWGP